MLGTGWEEGGNTIRIAVVTEAPGWGREEQRAEGRTRSSYPLPSSEGGITPTDRQCRLLAQPEVSGDQSTQASHAIYGIYWSLKPPPLRST